MHVSVELFRVEGPKVVPGETRGIVDEKPYRRKALANRKNTIGTVDRAEISDRFDCPKRKLVLSVANVAYHRPTAVEQRPRDMDSDPLAGAGHDRCSRHCHSREDTRIAALVKLSLSNRLRAALEAPEKEPPLAGDLPELRAEACVPAAVLIALTDRADPGVILTVRREHLRTHAGQIAFPGGRRDPGEQPVDCALREAFEEIGLAPAGVEIVAALTDYRTVTGYAITPVIGVVPPGLQLEPHEEEVASWFEASLRHLLDPVNQRRESAVFGGLKRHYWAIQWQDKRIWGATAAILVNLARRLQWNG